MQLRLRSMVTEEFAWTVTPFAYSLSATRRPHRCHTQLLSPGRISGSVPSPSPRYDSWFSW